MKKSKRIQKWIVLLCLGLCLFTSCGNKPEAKEGKNRLEKIKERGYIEVVTEPYFAPYEFIDPAKAEGEKVLGADMELAKYIAEKLGVDLRIVPLEFSAVLSGVSTGKYDLAISAIGYTPERNEAIELSKGYAFSADDQKAHGLLIREGDLDKIRGPNDLEEKIIVAQSGSLQEGFVNREVLKTKEFKKVSASTDGYLMVQEGKADAAAVNKKAAQLYIDANKDCGLVIVEGFSFTEPKEWAGNRIGMPKGEKELLEAVNQCIDEVVESGKFPSWEKEYTDAAKKLGL